MAKTQEKTTPKHDHAGHRRRLIEKMDSGSLCEHEYLEILLFNAVPRRNTNGLAHKLLAEFGSIEAILRASYQELAKVSGVGPSIAAYLACVGKFTQTYAMPQTCTFPKVFQAESFYAYVKKAYTGLSYEVLDVYLVDGDSRIYRRKQFSTKDMFNVYLESEKFSVLLGDDNPSGIVIVHNHPNGDMYPSETDDITTQKVQLYCSMHNILLCDHLVYSPNGIYSYELTGRLEKIRAEICVDKVVGGGV